MEEKLSSGSLSDQELIERMEKAARKGAKAGARSAGRFHFIFNLVIVLILGFLAVSQMKLPNLFSRDEPVENHDLTLNNQGVLGYTAVDFADAILGDTKQLKKLEVFTAEVSDVATVTDTGLGNLKVFSKVQLITFHGSTVYTVDLSSLSRDDITVNEDEKTVTLSIPHAQRGDINVPSDKMEFGDVDKGLLAFGEIHLTPEENAKIETKIMEKMNQRLDEDKVDESADKFAAMSVGEIFQRMIESVSPDYKLDVVFQ